MGDLENRESNMSNEKVAKKPVGMSWRMWLMAQSPGNTPLLTGVDITSAKVAMSRMRRDGTEVRCTTRADGDKTRFIFW